MKINKKYCLPTASPETSDLKVVFLTAGHGFSAQTRLLRRPLPAVHVQHCVQENPPYVLTRTCPSKTPGSSRWPLIYLRALHFQLNPRLRRRVEAEVRGVSAGPPLWVVPPHCRTPQASQAPTPNSSTTATSKAPSRRQRAVRSDATLTLFTFPSNPENTVVFISPPVLVFRRAVRQTRSGSKDPPTS